MKLGKIGSRSMFGWRNPYVTDGLIAMWDGEWNAGGGVHDPAATTWVDLAGERDFSLYGVGVCDNHMVFGSNSYATASPVFQSSDMMTLEVIMEVKSATSAPCYMSFFNRGSYVGDMFWYSKGCIAWGVSKAQTRVESACAIKGRATWSLSAHSFVRPNAPYVNGLPVGPDSISEYYGSPRARGLVINPTTSWTFSGDIYSIRIYNRSLTAEEIAANFAVDNARFNLTGGGVNVW